MVSKGLVPIIRKLRLDPSLPKSNVIFCSCGEGEQYDIKNATFFLNHPHLKWVCTTGRLANTVPGVIPVKSAFGTGYVGRIQVKFLNGTFTQIGKIFLNTLWYTRDNLNSEVTSTTDDIHVLACQP